MRHALTVCSLSLAAVLAQEPPALHGKRPATLELRGGHVLRGDGSPPYGPASVWVEDGRIVAGPIERPEAVLDATGCWVLPGLVNTHGHLQEAQAGVAMPMEYQLDLWLACGVTTVRDLGSTFARSLRMRERSRNGELRAPRILLYQGFGPVATAQQAAQRVQAIHAGGADGIKFWSNYSYGREVLDAALARAREVGLRATAHIGVGPSNALTYADAGITSLEHWYGIPDAALRGVQQFPPEFSYSNEVDRFRWAGRLWRETEPERLDAVLAQLVERGVAWSPTLAVYEASRDVARAQHKPEFRDYLHPALERFFQPNLEHHGSYFLGWTTTDEVFWKENYRLWMQALRRFADLGGTVTTGEDAGYIYLLYGFGLLRELELQHEAGFHPLEVLRHATWHGARVLGMDAQFGRVLPGLAADLVVVHGNPLANLKAFLPGGCDWLVDGKAVRSDGVRYTLKEGWIWHAPTLLAGVRELVAKARATARTAGKSVARTPASSTAAVPGAPPAGAAPARAAPAGSGLDGPLWAAVLRLGVPLAVAMGLHALVNLVDLAIVGALCDEAALAGVHVATTINFLPMIVGNGISVATLAMLSRLIGAGRLDEARALSARSQVLMLVAGVVLGLAGAALVVPSIDLQGATGAARETGLHYLLVSQLGCVTMFALIQLTTSMRAVGETAVPVGLLLFANVLNLGLNFPLILGVDALGIPALGAPGAAYATVAARGTGAVLGWWWLRRRAHPLRLVRPPRAPRGELGTILWLGLPQTVQMLVRAGAVILITRVAADLAGQTALAAVGVTTRLDTLVLFAALGFGSAATTLVAYQLGAGRPARAKTAAWLASAFASVFAGALVLALAAWPEFWIGAVKADATPELRAIGAGYLRVAALAHLPAAFCIAVTGGANGAGRPFAAMLIDLAGHVCVLLPLVLLAGAGSGSLRGVWWSLVAGHLVLAAAYAVCLARVRWATRLPAASDRS
jgi:putative MATE family efflux protein